MIDMSRYLL